MRRVFTAALAVALCLSPLAALPLVAGGVPEARLVVSGLSVAPAAPVADEPVTVTATVRNSAGSPRPVRVESVRLVRVETNETLARTHDPGPGSLSQGDTLTVDLTTEFRTPGRKDLRVVAVGTDANGSRVRVARPTTVLIGQPPPQLELAVPEPVAGTTAPVTVTVSNPATTTVRNLELRLDAPGARVERRTVPALAAGATTTVNLSYRPRAGTHRVAVDLGYEMARGTRANATRATTVRAAPLRDDVGVAVRPVRPDDAPAPAAGGQLGALLGATGAGSDAGGGSGALRQPERESGSPTSVEVAVTNFGNAPVRDVVVEPRAGNRSLPRQFVGRLDPGETGTVEVDLSGLDGRVTVRATARYDVADRTRRARGTFRYAPPRGELRLTDVDLTFVDRDGDGREEALRVTGNAGNVGGATVDGVVVAVGRNEHVRPAYPGRTYFVGTVEGSEFAPFELTARIDARNATGIPVRITYLADGERRTRETTLSYSRRLAPDRDDGGPLSALGAPGPLGIGLGAGVGLLVVGLPALYLARRKR